MLQRCVFMEVPWMPVRKRAERLMLKAGCDLQWVHRIYDVSNLFLPWSHDISIGLRFRAKIWALSTGRYTRSKNWIRQVFNTSNFWIIKTLSVVVSNDRTKEKRRVQLYIERYRSEIKEHLNVMHSINENRTENRLTPNCLKVFKLIHLHLIVY